MDSSFTGPVNLGNPAEHTLYEFATLVQTLTKSSSLIEYHPARPDDPKRRCPDISLAQKLLGWNPRVSLREGLLKTLDQLTQGALGQNPRPSSSQSIQ